jgi:hypothetical protein
VAIADEWAQFEPYLRDMAYRGIESDPGFLLDHEGGPYGISADLILGRLIGHDDQVVRDDLHLDRIRDVVLEPMFPRMAFHAAPPEVVGDYPDIRTAEYGLRSGYAFCEMDVASVWPPAGVEARSGRYTVLFLRYKRRLPTGPG